MSFMLCSTEQWQALYVLSEAKPSTETVNKKVDVVHVVVDKAHCS